MVRHWFRALVVGVAAGCITNTVESIVRIRRHCLPFMICKVKISKRIRSIDNDDMVTKLAYINDIEDWTG